MSFINYEKPNVTGQLTKHILPNIGVGQLLWSYDDSIKFSGNQPLFCIFIILHTVCGVNGCHFDTIHRRGDYLISHESQEWRHYHRRTIAFVTEEPRGNEVDSTLAPSRALHNKRPLPSLHNGLNRPPLAGAKLDGLNTYGLPENGPRFLVKATHGKRHPQE